MAAETGEQVKEGYTDLDRDASWLLDRARQITKNSRRIAKDGTEIWSPAGLADFYHNRTYPRDFYYHISAAPECFTKKQLGNAIRFFFAHQRDDGRVPNNVYMNGHVGYSLEDNSQFMVNLVYLHKNYPNPEEFYEHQFSLFSQYTDALERAMAWLPIDDKSGLVTGVYGFNDTNQAGAGSLFTSLLYVEAAGKMRDMYADVDMDNIKQSQKWDKSRSRMIANLQQLYDKQGFFYAYTEGKNRLPSVWGSAFAVYIGATTPEQTRAIGNWLCENYPAIVQRGQVRHLPKPLYWDIHSYPKDVYQNGGYWATPFAWVNRAIRNVNPKLADRMLQDIAEDFQRYGINEVVNHDVGYLNRAGHGGEYCASLSPLIVYRELNAPFIPGYTNLALAGRGGKVSASSVYQEGRERRHQIEHLNDGRFGNNFSWIPSASDPSPWLQVQLAGPSRVDMIIFGRDNWADKLQDGHRRPNRTGLSDRNMTTFKILVSDDGKNWGKPIHVETKFPGIQAGENHVIKLDRPVACRFVRMEFQPSSACVDEFEVFGTPITE